jgi:hypothetical protein
VVNVRPHYIPSDAILVLTPIVADHGALPHLLARWYAAPGPRCVTDPLAR